MELRKFLVKMINQKRDRAEWVHVSYVDAKLYDIFMSRKHIDSSDLNDYLSRWVKEDFNVDLAMSSDRDLFIMKELIKDFYKRAHPELYIESSTDRQGWVRVWLSKKMKEELNIYGKECF